VLPSKDFVLISALERHLGVSLRKEQTANAPPAAALRPARSVLASGSVPLFEKQETASSRELLQSNFADKDVLFTQEDLLGDIEEEDETKATPKK